LSQLYKSSGDAEAAIKRMEEVKKLDPKNTENLFNLGREYFDNTNYERAVENFTALLSLEPTDISAYSYLGASYQNSGKFNEALTAYKKATDIQPDNKKLLTDIATCYRELGSFATARTYANKALAIDANYGLAYIVRGEIYESAVESCMKSRGKESPEFDDKLVFELAYKEYQKATSDLQFKDLATTKLRYLQDFIPKKEDRFFHKHTEAKLSCYKWIY
jgi:tetratricopeptide (TPR) repeat protein